ncbi:MAG: J domain-containing protein [Chloroflexota bacterium]|nr:J domain-containing protein [Chloroflexota bacterium]
MSNVKNDQMDENPYEVIGVSSTASDNEIRRAYFTLVREYPPEQSPEQFKRIRAAYEMLRDPAQRAEWDIFVALQPPLSFSPSLRRPKPDLALHREDVVWVLRAEIESRLQDFERDFYPIALP